MLERLFMAGKIGKMDLKNRLVVSPMVCDFCTQDGAATERFIAYLAEKAKGGFGLVITENYSIRPDGKGFSNMACIHDDSLVAGHARVAEAVHKNGAKIVAQITHAGRQTESAVNGEQLIAPSPIPCPDKQEMPRELTKSEIKELVEAFGDAARRLEQAGFDGVEIHGGHGYLIAEFMSSYSNKRVDEYGGVLFNRLRFVREIIADIRKKTSPGFAVLFRISSEEQMPGGRTLQDTMAISLMLEKWGVDAIDVSIGTYGDGSTIPSMAISRAWNINATEQLKKVVSIPVMAVGRINDPIMAEAILSAKEADFILMGRGSLADPHLPEKAQAGEFDRIRQCIGCMQGCIGRLVTTGPIACLVNPQLGYEYEEVSKAKQPLNVCVIGGGPAGIEAARGASMRGHDVTLYEKANGLGGMFRTAAYPPYKGELSSYSAWAMNDLRDRGVNILLNTECTPEMIKKCKYDVAIIATGGRLAIPENLPVKGENVVDATDLIAGRSCDPGQVCAVLGGGMVGLEAAVHLGWMGRQVTIFEMRDEIAMDVESGVLPSLMDLVEKYGVDVKTGIVVTGVDNGEIRVIERGQSGSYRFDTVVLALGLEPEDGLFKEIEGMVDRVVLAGDAEKPGKAIEATRNGFVAGCRI